MNLPLKKVFYGLAGALLMLSCESRYVLQISTLRVDSLSQIILLEDSLVQPIIYSGLSGLADQPVPQAKKLFISAILPSILIAKNELEEERLRLLDLRTRKKWKDSDSVYFLTMMKKYRAADFDNLLLRLEAIPNSIVLAQAAVESGWGQSRFFLEGNNIFGIWSYNESEPRIPAGVKRDDQAIHVRAYDNMAESITDYFETLGTAAAYRGLRQALKETDNPLELLPHLRYYSERRNDYVWQLRTVIEQNNLTQYDHYRLDPQYRVTQ